MVTQSAPTQSSKGGMPNSRACPLVLPGVQRVASPLGRVQGGSACAGCKGKALARSSEAEHSGPVKCRKRSGPEGSTLCTGYYLSKQVPFGKRNPPQKRKIAPTKQKGGDRPSQIRSNGYPVTMAVQASTAFTTPSTTTAASMWRTPTTSKHPEPR